MKDEIRREKEVQQQDVLAGNDFVYLGNGPKATGAAVGWRTAPNIYFKCVLCDYLMASDPFKDDECFCGAMYKDAMAGRFGSNLRDAGIEVYEAHPKETT